MKSIIITGSTRGIGLGLADAFLARGQAATVHGRTPQSVQQATETLAAKHGRDRLHGFAADVGDLSQMEALWTAAQNRFGAVDIWINNAGLGHDMTPMWQLPPEAVQAVVEANILGTLNGARVAIRHMQKQGHGQLYNMLGHGATGKTRPGMAVYGMSKAAVKYLTDALIEEVGEETAVQISSLSPGMVITDLITDRFAADPEVAKRAKRIMNILADRVETVAPWLADRILANHRTGARIRWLTPPKIMWRFLTAPIRKRNLFDD